MYQKYLYVFALSLTTAPIQYRHGSKGLSHRCLKSSNAFSLSLPFPLISVSSKMSAIVHDSADRSCFRIAGHHVTWSKLFFCNGRSSEDVSEVAALAPWDLCRSWRYANGRHGRLSLFHPVNACKSSTLYPYHVRFQPYPGCSKLALIGRSFLLQICSVSWHPSLPQPAFAARAFRIRV